MEPSFDARMVAAIQHFRFGPSHYCWVIMAATTAISIPTCTATIDNLGLVLPSIVSALGLSRHAACTLHPSSFLVRSSPAPLCLQKHRLRAAHARLAVHCSGAASQRGDGGQIRRAPRRGCGRRRGGDGPRRAGLCRRPSPRTVGASHAATAPAPESRISNLESRISTRRCSLASSSSGSAASPAPSLPWMHACRSGSSRGEGPSPRRSAACRRRWAARRCRCC